jgi:hypothetical protein
VTKVLTIVGTFASTVSSQTYTIIQDFTNNFNLPLINKGDVETATLYSRAMKLIDDRLIVDFGADPSGVQITQAGHDFLVGNVIACSGNPPQWFRSTNDDENIPAVGMVSQVIDANTFVFKTGGKITAVYGGVEQNNLYYLKNVIGEDKINITKTVPDIGPKIPVFWATSSTTGYLLTIFNKQDSVFSQCYNGLVPLPGVNEGFLRHDATWQSLTVGDESIKSRHLTLAVSEPSDWETFWTNFEDANSDYSLKKAFSLIKTRIDTLFAKSYFLKSEVYDFSGSGNYKAFSLVIPTGVTKVKIRLEGGGGTQLGGSWSQGGGVISLTMTVAPAYTLYIEVGNISCGTRLYYGSQSPYQSVATAYAGFTGGVNPSTVGGTVAFTVAQGVVVLENRPSEYLSNSQTDPVLPQRAGKVLIDYFQ